MQDSTPQENPRIAVVSGGTSSGKGAPARMIRASMNDNLVYANTDNIRSMLPENGAFVGNDKAGFMHEEAGAIRDELLKIAMDGRRNIVLDAPGSAGIADFVAEAEKRGYTVSVDYVHRRVEDAQEAAFSRKYIADELPDLRDVPKDRTFSSHMKARGILPKLSKGREFRMWDSDQGFPAKVVFDRDASGKVKVYNKERLGVISNGQNEQLPKIPETTFR